MTQQSFTGDEPDTAFETVSTKTPPHVKTQMVEPMKPRRAMLVSFICALVALFVEFKAMMVIPMTGTFIGELKMDPVTASWVLLSAMLVGAVSNGILARLGDIYGHRKVLLLVLTAIALGNLLTGLAQNTEMILAGRVLSGVSATTALLLAIQRDWMEGPELRRGIGFIAGIQSIGVSLSFLFAGVFLEIGMSWRGVFLICAGLAVVNIVTLLTLVPESVTRANVKVDWLGALGLGIWLTLLLLAVSKSTTWGWTGQPTIICLVVAVVVAAVWAVYENNHKQPLVNLRVLFGPRLLPAYLATSTMSFGAFICYIGITNFVQIPREVAGYGFGYTVLQGGLVLLPACIVMTVMSYFTGNIIARFGARRPMVLGLVLMAATFFYWADNHGQTWQLVLPTIIWAIGLALVFAGGFTVATVEAPQGDAGISNGMLMIWSSIGSAMGTAVTAALRSKEFIPGTAISVEAGWSQTFLSGAIVACIGVAFAFLIPKGVGQGEMARSGSLH